MKLKPRSIQIWLLIAALGLSAGRASAAATAFDTATNYAGLCETCNNPPNLGSGFGEWTISSSSEFHALNNFLMYDTGIIRPFTAGPSGSSNLYNQTISVEISGSVGYGGSFRLIFGNKFSFEGSPFNYYGDTNFSFTVNDTVHPFSAGIASGLSLGNLRVSLSVSGELNSHEEAYTFSILTLDGMTQYTKTGVFDISNMDDFIGISVRNVGLTFNNLTITPEAPPPPPTIIAQPVSQTNYASATVSFFVQATNTYPQFYHWQKNGTNLVNGGRISGATSNVLTITSISDSDAANYSVIVSNAFGGMTSSNATLTVNDSLFIAAQPLSQTVGLGSNVTFSVTTYGAPPFVFQWYFNNSPVGSPTAGTNVSFYTVTNVRATNSGSYSVQAFNGYGSLMSSNAVLTVVTYPPTIVVQPTNQNSLLGTSASFSVSVNGSAPFFYQWLFNGTNILNATNAVYFIPAVDAFNSGAYSVIVTNLAASTTSSNAILTVIVPPTLTLQFLAGYPLLKLNGMLSSNFTVQYSTNLAGTNWFNLLFIPNLSVSPYQFLDPIVTVPPARFYRAVMQ